MENKNDSTQTHFYCATCSSMLAYRINHGKLEIAPCPHCCKMPLPITSDTLRIWKNNVLATARYHRQECHHGDCGVTLYRLKEMAMAAGVKFDEEGDFAAFM